VRRKLFWVERWGYIEQDKGLVYFKSKNSMKDPRVVPLKGKVLMKGKRSLGNEFLAV